MNGKTIVLVGGSSGIGQAVLNRLTGEGADVLHFSRSKALRNAPAGVSHNVFDAVSDELAPRIRVNAVAPSLTDTPLASGLLSDEDRRKAAAERHPLK